MSDAIEPLKFEELFAFFFWGGDNWKMSKTGWVTGSARAAPILHS